VLDKTAVVGRRPRSDEYNPTAVTHAAAAVPSAGDIQMNNHHHLARPHHHYSDYVQVREVVYFIEWVSLSVCVCS